MIMNYIITSIKKDELKKVEKVFGKYIVTVGEHASWLGNGFVEGYGCSAFRDLGLCVKGCPIKK